MADIRRIADRQGSPGGSPQEIALAKLTEGLSDLLGEKG